jgi:hypothetical protein
MVVSDAEVERLARDMIAQHGPRAARVAAEKLNEMIDRDNVRAGEVWACVVHLIHQRQGTGPAWAGQLRDWRNEAPRLAAF